HHAFGIGHQAHAGDARVFEQLADAVELSEKVLDVGEVAVGGQLDGRHAIGQGADGLQDAALEGEDVLHVPLQRGRHADEAHGFGSGGAIQHDHVVDALAAELIDVHHRAQFFHAGQDGQLLGLDVVDAGGAEHAGDVGGNFAPVPLDLFLD